MQLAETLKREILNNGGFDGDVVTDYLRKFFNEQPKNSLTISFFDHYDWVKNGVAIEENTASRRHGNKYADIISLPASWTCDMERFLRDNGFLVWTERHSVTKELFRLRVSLC